MKAILIFISIFYLLGLKFSQTIDFFKKCAPVEKIVTNSVAAKNVGKAIFFYNSDNVVAKTDSAKNEINDPTAKIKPAQSSE